MSKKPREQPDVSPCTIGYPKVLLIGSKVLLPRLPPTGAPAKVVAEVLEDVLGRLRLAGAGLARHDDGLRLLHHLKDQEKFELVQQ